MEMGRMKPEKLIPPKTDCIYTSCYCEENVWKLCEYILNHAADTISNYFVVFISNKKQSVPLWKQQSSREVDNLAIWDYHVILIFNSVDDGVLVYDLDTILDFPCRFETFASESLRTDFNLREDFQRKFRVIPAKLFLETFSSDRSRMKKDGVFIKPPPNYPEIQAPNKPKDNLNEFISMDPTLEFGEVLDFNKFIERFSGR